MIRKAAENDIEVLIQIFSELFSKEFKSNEIIKDYMCSGKREYYILFIDEKPVGAIAIRFEDDCEIRGINTTEKNKGYGSKLLKFAEKLAKERGYDKIWCRSNERHQARDFYIKNNWKQEEFIIDYRPGENVFKFSKELN